VTGLIRTQTKLLDGTINNRTGVRLVAAGLRVFSDAPAVSAQGKLAIIATSEPSNSAVNGGLPLNSYTQLSGAPQDLVSFQSLPCAGWKSGQMLHAVAIPSSPAAFQMNALPGTGSAAYGYPQLCAILSGAAYTQTFTYQIVFDYEFMFTMSNVTGVADDPIYNAGPGAISNITSSMLQQGVTRPGPLALTSGGNTTGVKAWLGNIHATMPGRAPQLMQLATRPAPMGGHTNNLGKTLSSVAHGALNLIGKYAPSWMGTVAKGAQGVLNFLGL
jgi:hypothetical protein